jgi:hypothetical protein
VEEGKVIMECEWEDDKEAWKYLRHQGFTHIGGIILSPQRQVTTMEDSAITYLHAMWDWGYQGDFV